MYVPGMYVGYVLRTFTYIVIINYLELGWNMFSTAVVKERVKRLNVLNAA